MTEPVVNIDTLTTLARLAITDSEKATLANEIPQILAFVDTIQSANVGNAPADTAHRNVMRDNAQVIETGLFTEKIIAEAPSAAHNRIVVKQVVSRTK
jgi:aspartyl/glutamyl-tRNA(Asn/Gln) amidotransferase C subunit